MRLGAQRILLISVLALFAGYLVQTLFTSMQENNNDSERRDRQSPVDGSPREPFSTKLLNLEGKEVTVQDVMEGETVVLNFWATWCPPCLREIPTFIKLQSKYREHGISFLGVALDDISEVSAFLEEMKLNYPVLIGDQQVIKMMEGLGNSIGALPYTVVLNRERNTIYSHQGEWLEGPADEFLGRQIVK